MEKGKNKRAIKDSAAPKATCGYIGYAPMATTGYLKCTGPNTKTRKLEWGSSKCLQKTKVTYGAKKQEVQPQSYERTSKIKNEDKKSGGYERYTAKEKVSFGQPHVERGSGKVGVKNECKKSSTIKVGNKGGYTEYYTEERVRKVDFDGKKKYGSSKNSLIADDGGDYYYGDGF